ncbi:hypothetical protein JCM8202_003185 [Rhodotorula sphaerocarpa]
MPRNAAAVPTSSPAAHAGAPDDPPPSSSSARSTCTLVPRHSQRFANGHSRHTSHRNDDVQGGESRDAPYIANGQNGRIDPDADGDFTSMLWWGYALQAFSTAALVLGLWSIVIGPLCAPAGWKVLDALVGDDYYKYLVVLLVPVTTCFVIVNWWGLKIFRHA